MYDVNIYAAQHHIYPNPEQSGRSERKKIRIFSKFDFGKLVLTVCVYSTGDTQFDLEQIATEAFMFLSICLWSK